MWHHGKEGKICTLQTNFVLFQEVFEVINDVFKVFDLGAVGDN